MEIEDDLFFSDLGKQIALLIMDDDDERDNSHFPIKHHTHSARPQGVWYPPSQAFVPPPMPPLAYYESACRRGTGVFIPRSTGPRRSKNRSGRSPAGPNRSSDQSRLAGRNLCSAGRIPTSRQWRVMRMPEHESFPMSPLPFVV